MVCPYVNPVARIESKLSPIAGLTLFPPVSWRLLGREVLFLSEKAIFNGAKAIRGGIPLVFPQVSYYTTWFEGHAPSLCGCDGDHPTQSRLSVFPRLFYVCFVCSCLVVHLVHRSKESQRNKDGSDVRESGSAPGWDGKCVVSFYPFAGHVGHVYHDDQVYVCRTCVGILSADTEVPATFDLIPPICLPLFRAFVCPINSLGSRTRPCPATGSRVRRLGSCRRRRCPRSRAT